jgi:hypothetical protein
MKPAILPILAVLAAGLSTASAARAEPVDVPAGSLLLGHLAAASAPALAETDRLEDIRIATPQLRPAEELLGDVTIALATTLSEALENTLQSRDS